MIRVRYKLYQQVKSFDQSTTPSLVSIPNYWLISYPENDSAEDSKDKEINKTASRKNAIERNGAWIDYGRKKNRNNYPGKS